MKKHVLIIFALTLLLAVPALKTQQIKANRPSNPPGCSGASNSSTNTCTAQDGANWRENWASSTSHQKKDGRVGAGKEYIAMVAYGSAPAFGSPNTTNSAEAPATDSATLLRAGSSSDGANGNASGAVGAGTATSEAHTDSQPSPTILTVRWGTGNKALQTDVHVADASAAEIVKMQGTILRERAKAAGTLSNNSEYSRTADANAQFPGAFTAVGMGWGTLLDSRSYSSFSTACADAVTKNMVLVVSQRYKGLATQSCAANLRFAEVEGPFLQPGNGQTITLSGNIDASLMPIFDPSAGGAIFLSGAPVVYPEWFGAVGDGIAIDGGAIQAAISSQQNNPRMVRVQLTGTYKIASQLYVLSSQTHLTLSGPGKITHAAALKTYLPLSGKAPCSTLVVYQAANVTVRDLTIDQTGLGTTGCDGVLYFDRSNFGIVDNVTTINTTGNGFHFYYQINDLTVSRSTAISPKLDGFDFHAASHRAHFIGNMVKDVGGVGTAGSPGVAYEVEGRIGGTDTNIQPVSDVELDGNQAVSQTQTSSQSYLVDWSQNVTINGGAVNNLGGVDILFSQNVKVSGVSFLNCPWAVAVSTSRFTHNWTGAEVGSSSRDVTITGNMWVYTAEFPPSPRFQAVYTVDSAVDVRVVNNPVANLTSVKTGATFFSRLSTLGPPTGLTISGNSLTGRFNTFIANADNIVAENNNVGLAYGGVLMTIPKGNVSNLAFRGNTVDNTNTVNLANEFSTATNLDFSGNTFKSLNQSIGLFTPSTATLVKCVISSNHFLDTTKTPIALSGAKAGPDTVVSHNIAKGSNGIGSTLTQVGNSF